MQVVTIPPELGGTGTPYNDGTGPFGMAGKRGYGYATYLMPMLSEVMAACATLVQSAAGVSEAVESAAASAGTATAQAGIATTKAGEAASSAAAALGSKEAADAAALASQAAQGRSEEALADAQALYADLRFATKALMDADLAHAADTFAVVYADSTPSNNQIYFKAGGSGSGSWVR